MLDLLQSVGWKTTMQRTVERCPGTPDARAGAVRKGERVPRAALRRRA